MHYLFGKSTLGVEAIGFQQSVQQLTDTMEKDGGYGEEGEGRQGLTDGV